MKIDIKFSGLDKLMKKMGANHLSWNSGKSLSKLELQQLYTPEGIEKSLDDIEMDENGHMFIDNAPVVLFIKDTWNEIYKLKNYPKGPNMKRFHILGNCKTIEQMKKKNRYDRYSFTADQSGKFSVWGFRDKADRGKKIQTIAAKRLKRNNNKHNRRMMYEDNDDGSNSILGNLQEYKRGGW